MKFPTACVRIPESGPRSASGHRDGVEGSRTGVWDLAFAVAGACGLVLGTTGALAGTGRARPEGAVTLLDFDVSIAYEASQPQLEDILGQFQAASGVLFDATDGQYAFGKICFINNSSAFGSAEVCILAGGGRARATNGMYGNHGYNVRLFQLDFEATAEGNPYIIAHEFAHHVWNLKDEYKGQCPGSNLACPAACAADSCRSDLTYCLMDNFRFLGGACAGGTITMNEFCVASNHDSDADTYQSNVHGTSCWETIANSWRFPASYPQSGVPIDDPGSQPFPELSMSSNQSPIVGLIYDVSEACISDATAIENAAMLFVDIVADSTTYLIWEQGEGNQKCEAKDWCVTNPVWPPSWPPEPLVGAESRDGIKKSMDYQPCDPPCFCPRDVPKDLIEAIGYLQEASGCNKRIILVSNGVDPTACGGDTEQAIQELLLAGISVTSVSVGPGADDEYMRTLAEQTGGDFYATDRASIQEVLASIAVEIDDQALLGDGSAGLCRSAGLRRGSSRTVSIDSVATEARFLLSWSDPGRNPQLALSGPLGQQIDEGSVDAGVAVRRGPGYALIILEHPALQAGTWQMSIVPDSLGAVGELLAAATPTDTRFAASTDRTIYAEGHEVTVSAVPYYKNRSVVGAEILGELHLPDGGVEQVTLSDDGDFDVSGDSEAGDGSYASRFAVDGGIGTYHVELRAVGTNATTDPGETLFDGPPDVLAVPDFDVVSEVSFRVQSASVVDGEVDREPNGALIVSPNPVPWGGAARVIYVLPRTGPVRLELFDASGRLVESRDLGVRSAGQQEIVWTPGGSDTALPSGAYFLRMKSPAGTGLARLVLVR